MNKDQVFWIEDPAVLMNKDYIREIWPQTAMEPPAKLNAITRFVILATILGYLVTSSFSIFVLGGITLGIIVMIYNFIYKLFRLQLSCTVGQIYLIACPVLDIEHRV